MKNIIAIISAMSWISISEFVRNEFIFKTEWMNHFQQLGTVFPSKPINGAIWGVWSLCFAIYIFILSRKFNMKETIFISWFSGFILMWLVIGNLNVLPYSILPIAIPLSLLEVVGASWLIFKIKKK